MPDNVDPGRAAKGRSSTIDENSPDLVGDELGDGARIWRVYDRIAREEDRERISQWNRGLDNLALFAGLFAAVTTAFIIEAQQDTEPDYARLTFLVLNASAAGVSFKEEPFVIDPNVQATNCLWITSLMLSLTAALIAIMGKDWIGMYASRPVCNPRQWAEIRTYRLACVERWYMSGVIAVAPVLLHISLVLFSAGFVMFVAPDRLSQRVALGLALAAGVLYTVTVLGAIVFPASPFKSPATQTVRGALISVYTFLYDRLFCCPKRNPVAMLQQATLLISAAVSHTLPDVILPLDWSQRRSVRTGGAGVIWNQLFSPQSPVQARSWRATAIRMAKASWTRSIALARSLPALSRSAVEMYNSWRQRLRSSPWHASIASYLRQIDLSDHWAEVRSQPTPAVLARSLSHLNAMTQSPDVLRSILVAVGDISIGREIAPLVSCDLKTRLETEIRQNWPKADRLTLSRYILADQHLLDTQLIPPWALRKISVDGEVLKSESIVFALLETWHLSRCTARTIMNCCPDIVTQPRTLQYLLPRVNNYEVAIVLALRYYDRLDNDQRMNLVHQLRRQLASWSVTRSINVEAGLHDRFGRCPGLLELLVFSLDYLLHDTRTIVCALILKALDMLEHPCVVYAFGHSSSTVTDAAWAAFGVDSSSAPMQPYFLLEMALPLRQFAPHQWVKSIIPPVSDQQRVSDRHLLRSIVLLLLPSRPFCNARRLMSTDSYPDNSISTLELCVRCLQLQLHSRSARDNLGIIAFILQQSVLIRVSSLGIDDKRTTPTAGRSVINVLTAIARRLYALLASPIPSNVSIGARLFCLFAFSETTHDDGTPVAWDLRVYMRRAMFEFPVQYPDANIQVSMRRLVLVLRALRPLCMLRKDLRAAWERIKLAPDNKYHDPFWDAEDFDLGPLLVPEIAQAGTSTQDTTTPPVTTPPVIEEFSALHWLDAAMH